uniref:Uncharacterized protein n=1 Tax=Rhizophora mucronata TaxID=61149 RepID=A0A2P2IKQ9_RHIMU
MTLLQSSLHSSTAEKTLFSSSFIFVTVSLIFCNTIAKDPSSQCSASLSEIRF